MYLFGTDMGRLSSCLNRPSSWTACRAAGHSPWVPPSRTSGNAPVPLAVQLRLCRASRHAHRISDGTGTAPVRGDGSEDRGSGQSKWKLQPRLRKLHSQSGAVDNFTTAAARFGAAISRRLQSVRNFCRRASHRTARCRPGLSTRATDRGRPRPVRFAWRHRCSR